MNKFFFIFFCVLFQVSLFAQNSLLDQLSSTDNAEKTKVTSTFKSYKLVNFETPKLVPKQHLNFIVAHRFGTIKNGIDDLFGLDIASTRLQFVYGLTDKINLSFSRSKFKRTYDFGLKYNITNQEKGGFPFTLAGHHLLGINTLYTKELYPSLEFSNRLRSTHQLIVATKINDRLSLELIPTILHDGVVSQDNQDNLQYALGFGGRYLFTKRMGIIADYGLHLNRADNSPFNNVFSLGFEIETGGHVFQLHFSNAQAMYENAFITEATGDWLRRDVFFGFNINRIFDLKSKK
ncbi:hypothetical protein AXE80_00045 [Wenyingzhuangia fucanilytica]|uniref:DUF5777 domain-containing protein n=1 Tax=Wenyingzhuangia fucanilytica TaxID=1790137 RepID=A0A1B1Y204_9FLAO|nr:DUF5777 family beta-barrel protein [Wenyingzhuangia fucanilytica]ANW94780.1 hypothetical protein AXE80_00045 [Wenyingzhuangia fucanilytica]